MTMDAQAASTSGAAGNAAPRSYSSLLPKQLFAGNPLERAYDTRKRFDGSSTQEEVSLIVVSGREVCVRDAVDAKAGVQYDLQALLLGANNPELDLNSDSICLNWVNGRIFIHDVFTFVLIDAVVLGSLRWLFSHCDTLL